MKRIIAILLIPMFLLSTAGVAITSLYCKGRLSEVGLSVSTCCKDVNKGGCCNTKTKVVKVKDAFISTTSSVEVQKIIDLFIPITENLFIPEIIDFSSVNTSWDKAPPLNKDELYILFRAIII